MGRTLNYSKTAEELFMSQPAVSKNIKKLELEMNTKLVNFAHHKVELTVNGQFLWNKLALVDAILDDTVASIQNNDLNEQPTFNIGFTDLPFEDSFLPRFISLVNEKYHYRINLVFLDPNGKVNLIESLKNKTVDLLLFQSDLFSKDKDLASTALLSGGFSVAVSKQNPLASQERLTLKELSGQRVLLWNGNELIPTINELKYEINDKYPNLNITDSYDTAILSIYAGANVAVGIVPSILFNPDSKTVNYVKLQSPMKISYSVGYLREKSEDKQIQNIIKTLKYAINVEKRHW